MKRMIIISLLIFLTFNISNVCAHDDVKVHPEITRLAVKNSTLDDYLNNNLNLTNGVNTKLPSDGGKFIIDWLKEGSTVEDDLNICRASNHFHDPMNKKPWSTSGMSDEPLWADAICLFWKPFYSDFTWATGFTDPASTPIPYTPGNNKSPNVWANARTLYYNALTATTQTTRENNFAQMFKALGQVMHLLQEGTT